MKRWWPGKKKLVGEFSAVIEQLLDELDVAEKEAADWKNDARSACRHLDSIAADLVSQFDAAEGQLKGEKVIMDVEVLGQCHIIPTARMYGLHSDLRRIVDTVRSASINSPRW